MFLKQLWGEIKSCVQVSSEKCLVPSGLQRRSHWAQSLQLCLRHSPCNSSREKAWWTATIFLQVAKLPPTLPAILHTQAQAHTKAEKIQNDGWRSPRPPSVSDPYLPDSLACIQHCPFNYLTQGSLLQTLTMGFGLGTTTVTENGKTALPNLLLHNRLSWL